MNDECGTLYERRVKDVRPTRFEEVACSKKPARYYPKKLQGPDGEVVAFCTQHGEMAENGFVGGDRRTVLAHERRKYPSYEGPFKGVWKEPPPPEPEQVWKVCLELRIGDKLDDRRRYTLTGKSPVDALLRALRQASVDEEDLPEGTRLVIETERTDGPAKGEIMNARAQRRLRALREEWLEASAREAQSE